MTYTVRLTHAAQRDIDELLEYLVPIAGQTVALGYISRLKYFLARLEEFPKRGTVRSDILEGLRIIGFERSLSVAFVVEGNVVHILRILNRGRQFHASED